MYHRITTALIAFITIALVGITASAKDPEADYRHEPAGVGEAVFFEVDADEGDGSGEIDLEATLVENTLYVTGQVSDLSSPVVENNTSKNGINLYLSGSKNSEDKVFPLELQMTNDESEGVIGGRIELNDEQVAQLRKGKLHVGVYTEDYPKGEVHGKLKSK